MYQAQGRGGRRTHAFFTPAGGPAQRPAFCAWSSSCAGAFDARDFRLFYQPLVCLADGTTGRSRGADTLGRTSSSATSRPSEFIPIAEKKNGLIVGVGDWVLREACRQLQIWRQIGLEVPPYRHQHVGRSAQAARMCGERTDGPCSSTAMLASDIEIEVTENRPGG